MLKARYAILSVAVACWMSPSVLSDGVPSRIFRAEGHGRRTSYYFPDDEVRRITALHDVVTPHIAWARPIRGGTVRVLAIAHKSQGRWPVELAQRFDFHVQTVYGQDSTHLGSGAGRGMFGQDRPDVEARLLQAMNEPIDVVISDISLAALGQPVRERLAALMARGVGYVGPTEGLDLTGRSIASQAQRGMIASAVPVAGLRALAKAFGSADKAAGKIVKLWTGEGVGRVADMTGYPRDNAKPDANRLQCLSLISMEQEGWCALAGRAVLWAARRVSAKSALAIDWPAEPIDRKAMPYTLPIRKRAGSSLNVRVWDADGRLRHRGAGPTVPRLPAGRYFVGIELLADRHVDDWAFGTISVRSAVDIASIELDSEYKKPGETVRATVMLSVAPPHGSRLRLEVLDNHGRCVDRRELAAAREATFEGDFAESLHIYNYVNVKLIGSDGDVFAEDRRAFFVARPGPPRDDLSWMVWEAGAGFNPRRRILLKQFARLGMTGALAAGDAAAAAAMVNAHPVLYAYKMIGVRVNEQGVTNPCFTSPGYRSHTIKQITKNVAQHRRFSPLFYYLGDDVRYTSSYGQNACWSPTCRAVLATWAKKTYGTLDKINQAWGTSYGDFKDIEPIKHADALAAVGKGHFAPLCHWVDHQLCTDSMVAGWWREMGKAIRQVAPKTPSNIGSMVVGWTWPGAGFDFWQIADGKDLAFQYPNPWVHDIFRCAARPDAFHGTWYGGYGLYNYPPYYDADYLPWWGVFRGINLHGQYYGGQGSAWYSERLLGADLGPMPGVEKILENFKELQSGIAKLLFNADRLNDGVAIAYSPASLHASAVFEKGLPKAPEWRGQVTESDQFIYMQCWEGMSYLMRDMGFSFDVVPSSHLADGRFSKRGFRVLVLPFHIRLTAGEAETIRQFVRAGGVLIADALPGMFDGRCRADHAGVLADVLGVKFAGGIPGPKIAMQTAAANDGLALGRLVVDDGLKLDGAKPMGKTAKGTPILLVNKYGQGCAILLNALARDYQIARTLATEMPLRNTVARLLAARAGLQPAIRCDVSGGPGENPHRIQATESHQYDLGGARYVGLLRHPKLRPDDCVYMSDLRPKPVWVTFDRKAHVYDVRRRMYRGLTDKIEDVVYAARAELYALMPYEVRDLKLTADRQGPAALVTAQIVPANPDAEPVTHVFHVETSDPAGQTQRELTRNVVAGKGRFTQRIFLGYNAQPGQWKVTVRDVVSGLERSVNVSF